MSLISESSRDLEIELSNELEKISKDESIKNLIIGKPYNSDRITDCVNAIEVFKSKNPKPEEKKEEKEEEEDPLKDLHSFLMILKATHCPDYLINEVINTRLRQKKVPFKMDTREMVEITFLLGSENVKQVYASRNSKYTPICENEIESFEMHWICRVCNRTTNSNQISIYCTHCYKPEKHQGHKEDVEFRINSRQAGICECGDIASFHPSSFCEMHQIGNADREINYEKVKEMLPCLNDIFGRNIKKIVEKDDNDENKVKEISRLMKFIRFLYEEDTIKFIEAIRQSLIFCPKSISTKHICDRNDPISSSSVEHICTCSILDNLIRCIPLVDENQIHAQEFFSEACKFFKAFRIDFVKSFWKVYSDLIPLYRNRSEQGLEYMIQILENADWEEEECENYLVNNYKTYWIENFKQVQKIVLEKPMVERPSILLYFFLKDFQLLLNNNYKLSKRILNDNYFLESYLEIANSFTFYENLQMRDIKLQENDIQTPDYCKVHGFAYYRSIFYLLLQGYDCKDIELNRKLGSFLRKYVQKVFLENAKILTNYNFNTLHLTTIRLFAALLLKMSYTYKVYAKPEDPPKILISYFKRFLTDIFDLKESEISDFSMKICYILLRELQFVAEIESQIWDNFGEKVINEFRRRYFDLRSNLCYDSDIFLLQFFILLVDENEISNLFTFFLGDKDALTNFKEKNSQGSSLYLDNILFFWQRIMMDDLSSINLYLKLCGEPYKDETPKELDPLYQHFIKKFAVLNFMCSDKGIKEFTIENVKEALPLHVIIKETEKIISSQFTKKIFNYLPSNIFNPEQYNLLNIFNCRSVKEVNKCFENTSLLIKDNFLHECHLYNPELIISDKFFGSLFKSVRIHMSNPKLIELFSKILIDSQLIGIPLNEFSKELIISLLFNSLSQEKNKPNDKLIMDNINSEFSKNQNLSKQLNLLKYDFIKLTSGKQNMYGESPFITKSDYPPPKKEELPATYIEGTCAFCKGEFKDSDKIEDVYGYPCYLGISEISKIIVNFQRNDICKFFSDKPIDDERFILGDLNKLMKKNLYLNCCNHKIHLRCLKEKEKDTKINFCPFCKDFLIEKILPIINDIKVKYPYDEFITYINDNVKKYVELPKKEKEDERFDDPLEDLLFFAYAATNMINIEYVILKDKDFDLTIISILRYYLKNILCLRKDKLLIEANYKVIEEYAKKLLTCWITDPIVVPFLSIMKFFVSLVVKEANPDSNMLSNKILEIIKEAFEIRAKNLLLLDICYSSKISIIPKKDLDDKISKSNFRKAREKEIIQYFQKLHLILMIFSRNSTINEFDPSWDKNFEKEVRSIILNSEKTKDEEYCSQLLRNFDIKEIFFDQVKRISIQEHNDEKNIAEKSIKMIIRRYLESTQKDPAKIDPNNYYMEISFFYNSLNKAFELQEVPQDYEKLILKFAPVNCRTCGLRCNNKAVCLLCQSVICPNSDCCRNSEKKGEATWHALECSGGAGYFIHLYYSQIIGIYMNKGVLIPKIFNSDLNEDYCVKLNENRYIVSTEARKYKIDMNFYNSLKYIILRNKVSQHIMKSIDLDGFIPTISTI